MYVSGRHPNREALLRRASGTSAPTPPRQDGRVLAVAARRSRGKPDQELRLIMSEYQGSQYLSLQTWTLGVGGFWPTKNMSIRLSEAEAIGRAILDAVGVDPAPRES